jgi:hypothetical protein
VNTHEGILERMANANPLPDTEMITDGQLAEMTLQVDRERRAAIGSHTATDREAAPAVRRTRPRWLQPALAFGAACALALGTIGISALLRTDQPGESGVGEPGPATTTAEPTSTAHSPDINHVVDIAVAPDGNLWTVTAGGLVHWDIESGTPTLYTPEQGLPPTSVRHVVVGRDGTVWAGGGGWLANFDGSWTAFLAPRDTDGPLAVAPDGTVWVAFREYELGRFDGSEWDYYETPLSWPDGVVGHPGMSLAFARDGTAWLSTDEVDGASPGVYSFHPDDGSGIFGEAWTHYASGEELPVGLGDGVVVAPDGTVWVGSGSDSGARGHGVASFDGTTWTAYGTSDGLPSGWLRVAVGADGSVWAVGDSGVARFDGSAWVTTSDLSGELPGAAVDGAGVLWLSATEADGGGIIGFDGSETRHLVVPVDATVAADPLAEIEPRLLPADGVAEPAPFTGSCPPGTHSDTPGPTNQERPASDWVGVQAAAFDHSVGRIVYVDFLGETWTFDVCTNTWHRMSPAGAMLSDLSGGLVYDVDSEATVALGWNHISVYDAAANAWTWREMPLPGDNADRINPFGGVYDPVSGLIVTSAIRGEEGSTSDPVRLEAWSYDVDENAWELLDILWTEEDDGDMVWSDLLGYSAEIDRFIFANPQNVTALVDLRTGEKTLLETPTPAVSFGWPKAQYGQAGVPFVARGTEYDGVAWGDALEDEICGFDTQAQAWTDCHAMPGGSKYRAYGAMIGDPVNNRLVLIHGVYGGWWVDSDDAVWAIDLDTGETTELLAPSE